MSAIDLIYGRWTTGIVSLLPDGSPPTPDTIRAVSLTSAYIMVGVTFAFWIFSGGFFFCSEFARGFVFCSPYSRDILSFSLARPSVARFVSDRRSNATRLPRFCPRSRPDLLRDNWTRRGCLAAPTRYQSSSIGDWRTSRVSFLSLFVSISLRLTFAHALLPLTTRRFILWSLSGILCGGE